MCKRNVIIYIRNTNTIINGGRVAMLKTVRKLSVNENIISEIMHILQQSLGDNLIRIVLYGSYARGDYNNFSDIDIFILVNNEKIELNRILRQISDSLFELDLKYNITINPLIENIDIFNEYKENYLLFENIEKEGIVLYG